MTMSLMNRDDLVASLGVSPYAQVCSTVCQDHDESCGGWAKEGECEENKPFMYRVCPASCGVCQLLESPDKEEL